MTKLASTLPQLTPKQRGVKRSNDHSPEPPPEIGRAKTIPQVAQLLSCCEKQVENFIADGEIQVFNVGRGKIRQSLRITDDAIAAFIKRRTLKPSVRATDPNGYEADYAAYLARKGKGR